MGILSSLEPASVFHYFEEICSIPHGSSNTKEISDYCVAFAKEHNLDYIQDEANNIIIFKPGTQGYENSAPVLIQGHLDMVCEKESGCNINMENEGLELQLENNTISAKGTTLGGDDGIAIAYALAILSSCDIPHPPLEAVFTVDEEIGMLGAANLDCSPLKSRIMLNLDSEDEGYLLVSCAGGITATVHLPVQLSGSTGRKMTLKLHGLLGGHSGVEIDKGRANACQLLGRTLYQLRKTIPFQIISVEGGQKDNAIPREAAATLLLPENCTDSLIMENVEKWQNIYQTEHHTTDPGIRLTAHISAENTSCQALTEKNTQQIIAALVNLPGGIQRMSHDMDDLVQTSLNLGILKTNGQEVTCSFCIRSSIETEKTELVDRITCLTETLGGTVSTEGNYPAWEYRNDSPLRELMIEIFVEQYGKKPIIQALHAGVECGLFSGKLPGLDCVSFGPNMKDIHTPQESMDVGSVQRTWKYILEILKRLK